MFEERECAVPVHYMVSLSVHRLLYDGIRQMKSETLVLKGLGSLDRCVTLAEVPPFAYEPKDNDEEHGDPGAGPPPRDRAAPGLELWRAQRSPA